MLKWSNFFASGLQHPIQCEVCADAIKPGSKNRRRNPSLLICYNSKNVLIDCGKSFRDSFMTVMLKYQIAHINALVLTHPHADAYLGLDDVREWTESTSLPIFVRDADFQQVATTFPYLANTKYATGSGYVSKLTWNQYTTGVPFDVNGLRFIPYLVTHGKNSFCSGFRIGTVVYLSDISEMPSETRQTILDGGPVELLIIDALQPAEKNLSHFSMVEAIAEARLLSAKKVYFVGMSHKFDYEKVNRQLREAANADPTHPDCELAYDTLKVDVSGEMLGL